MDSTLLMSTCLERTLCMSCMNRVVPAHTCRWTLIQLDNSLCTRHDYFGSLVLIYLQWECIVASRHSMVPVSSVWYQSARSTTRATDLVTIVLLMCSSTSGALMLDMSRLFDLAW
jgi:hypothetical protein